MRLAVVSIVLAVGLLAACGGGGTNSVSEGGMTLRVGSLSSSGGCFEVPFTLINSSGATRFVGDDFIFLVIEQENKEEAAIIPSFLCKGVSFSDVEPSEISRLDTVTLNDGKAVKGVARYEQKNGYNP